MPCITVSGDIFNSKQYITDTNHRRRQVERTSESLPSENTWIVGTVIAPLVTVYAAAALLVLSAHSSISRQ